MTDTSVAAIELAMNQLQRSHARRTLGQLAEQRVCDKGEVTLVPVLDAIEQGPGDGGSEVTVGVVAERLGLDPSRASRLVSAAIHAGLVVRVASQQDGRRIHLELSEAGTVLAAEAHRFRQAHLARVLAGWSAADKAAFAALVTRFIDDMGRARPC